MNYPKNLFTPEIEKIEHILRPALSQYASIGVGGRAQAAFFPKSISSTVCLVEHCKRIGQRYVVLGNATNVLPCDEDTDLVVVFTTRLRGTTTDGQPFAFCGETTADFLNACERANLTGAEFLEGIPATVGGALFMNAGACGKKISDVVESVLVYHEGDIKLLKKSECDYSYKHSVFMQGGYVILGATFALDACSQKAVAQKRAEYRQTRAKLPTGKSMGCVFKNPLPESAGRLVEGAGLKGMRIGDAFVSREHANFIINGGNATAKQIKQLAQLMKAAVQSAYGISLEEEIRYVD